MKTKDLAIILVRAFAIWLLFQCTVILEQVPLAFLNPTNATDSVTRYYAFINILTLAFYLILGVGFLKKDDHVANLLTRRLEQDARADVSMNDLAIVSFGVAGIFIFVDGVEKALIEIIKYSYKLEPEFGRAVLSTDFNAAMFIVGITKVLLGLILILGTKGIVRAVKIVREKGTTQSSA